MPWENTKPAQSSRLRHPQVRGRTLNHYAGNFSKFLAQREAREAAARAEAEAQQAEIDKLEEFVTRFGAKASKVCNGGGAGWGGGKGRLQGEEEGWKGRFGAGRMGGVSLRARSASCNLSIFAGVMFTDALPC